MNLTSCDKCKRDLISEEIELHQCKPLLEYRIEGKVLWVNDGEKWYPLKFTNRKFTERKTTSDFTAPVFGCCQVCVGSCSCQKASGDY